MIGKIIGLMIAASITVALFLLMNYLIVPKDEIPAAVDPGKSIIITRPEREEVSERKKRIKPERPVLAKNTPPPIIRTTARVDSRAEVIDIEIPEYDIDENAGLVTAPASRRATPLVRIPPQYPHSAQMKGREGWVLVEFTITRAGTVEDIIVIDAEPENVFDRETIRALSRWKYQPKIIDGKPVPQYNMQELVTYRLES